LESYEFDALNILGDTLTVLRRIVMVGKDDNKIKEATEEAIIISPCL
jgi:hypothetical protein